MKELILKSHPVFEPDQLLTSDDLNSLFDYLEQQQRIERVALTTLGCTVGFNYTVLVNGLNVPNVIKVLNGHAVTIDGYQTVLTNKEGGINNSGTDLPKEYKYYIKYIKPGSTTGLTVADFKKLCEGPFSSKETPAPLNLPADNNNTYTFYELLTEEENQAYIDVTNTNPALPLTGLLTSTNALNDYLLTLYVEISDTNNPNCNPNSCNDKGQMRNFRVVPLLVNKSLNLFPVGNYIPVELKTTYLKKFKALNDAVPIDKNTSNWTTYRSKFYQTAYDNLGELDARLSDIKTAVATINVFVPDINIMANVAYPTSSGSVLSAIRALVNPGNNALISNKILLGQDYYNFCFDIMCATNEFVDAFNEIFEENMNESISTLYNRRLRFTVLGALTTNVSEYIDQYRYYGVRINQLQEQSLRFKKLQRLYNRIWLMIFAFARRYSVSAPSLNSLPFLNQLPAKSGLAPFLNIVPSKYAPSKLGERSMPSYFSINPTSEENILLSHWKGSLVNYKTNTKGVFTYWDQSFPAPRSGYATSNYNNGEENYPYYRIDGHIGMTMFQALAYLSDKFVKQNLPIGLLVFDLKKIGTNPLRLPPGTEHINGAWAQSTFVLFVDRNNNQSDYTVLGDCCMREYIHSQNLYYKYTNPNSYNYDHFRYPLAYEAADVTNWLVDPLYNPLNKFYNGIQIIRDTVSIPVVVHHYPQVNVKQVVGVYGKDLVKSFKVADVPKSK